MKMNIWNMHSRMLLCKSYSWSTCRSCCIYTFFFAIIFFCWDNTFFFKLIKMCHFLQLVSESENINCAILHIFSRIMSHCRHREHLYVELAFTLMRDSQDDAMLSLKMFLQDLWHLAKWLIKDSDIPANVCCSAFCLCIVLRCIAFGLIMTENTTNFRVSTPLKN